jgi:hypothetical protein
MELTMPAKKKTATKKAAPKAAAPAPAPAPAPTPAATPAKSSKPIHDVLADKREKLVEDLAAVDEEIAEVAEKARTGDV